MQNLKKFIQLSLTLTKLYHIKCDHSEFFYISLEKTRKIAISLQQFHWSTKLGTMMQNVCLKNTLFLRHTPIKKFHFKNPRWRTADTLERPVLHYHEYCNFQDGGCPSSWNFEIESFDSRLLERHILSFHVKRCGDRSNCCRDIAFCRVFQVKCKKTHYDRT